MPEMRAALMVASLGGKTRFSTNVDSTAVDGELMGRSPLVKNARRKCESWHLQATDVPQPDETSCPTPQLGQTALRLANSSATPAAPLSNDPSRTPILTWTSYAASAPSNASEPMNR